MDKIFSARLDENVIQRIGSLARVLGTTKKAILENAVRKYAEMIEKENKSDMLDQTFGAWRRKESAAKTVEKSRKAFRDSMNRYRK